MRYSRRLMVVAAVLVGMAQLAVAQVLDQVPSNALIVVKFKNLGETNTKLAAFLKELGVDQMSPEMADPLASLKKELKIEQGLDEKGELAFAFLDPSSSGAESEEQSILMLIPVSDYKAFTGNFADAKAEGDVTEVTTPNDTEPSYLASWGKYAAMSPSKALVSKKPAVGVKLAGLTAREMTDKDAIFYANLAAVRKTALPALQNAREEMIGEATKELTGDKAKYQPAAKAVVTQALNIAERFLQDADAATYGVSFAQGGIKGTLMCEFTQGSYLGNAVKKITNSNDALLTGLPNAKYLVYGGYVSSPDATKQVIDDVLAPVIKEVQALGDEGKPLLAYVDSFKKITGATRGAKFGMVAPAGMLGQESIIQMLQVMNGDAKAIGEAQKEMVEHQEQLMQIVDPNGVQAKTVFSGGVRTVDGVTLDQFKTDFSGQANNPQAAQMQQMMQMLYGASGLNMMTGQVDDNTRVIGAGVSDDLLQQLITATKTKDDALAKSDLVTQVSAELPKQRVGVVYIALDNILTTAAKYAQGMGAPFQFDLPPNQPPIGASVATEETAIRIDTYVPTQLVKSITAAVIRTQMQMQGGGMGGGM